MPASLALTADRRSSLPDSGVAHPDRRTPSGVRATHRKNLKAPTVSDPPSGSHLTAAVPGAAARHGRGSRAAAPRAPPSHTCAHAGSALAPLPRDRQPRAPCPCVRVHDLCQMATARATQRQRTNMAWSGWLLTAPPRGWSRSAPQAVTHPSGSCGRTSWIFCSAHRHVARPHCSPAIAAPAPLGSTAGQPRCAGRPLSPAWDLHVLRKFSPQPPRRPPCRPCHVLRPPRVAFQLGARLLWTRAGNLDRPLYLTAGLCRYSPEWTPPGKGAHPVQKKGQYLKFNVEECALFLAHILY